MTLPIRVGIVDDHAGVRIGIRNLLASAKDIIIVGEGANGAEAIQLATQTKPDILLLDVELPILRGDEVAHRLREAAPSVKILAVSSYNDPIFVQGMLENGAAGYITKEEAPHLLVKAVRSIIRDQVKWISPNVARRVSKITLDNKVFTGNELDILRLIALDKEDEEIMRALNFDQGLLTRFIDLLMAKLDLRSREDLKYTALCLLSTSSF